MSARGSKIGRGLILAACWAAALAVIWYLAASSYERFLGNFAYRFFPEEAFLLLRGHVFSIGLGSPDTPGDTLLQYTTHNFGFGFVVIGAVVLGIGERSWILRCAFLTAAWVLLFLTQTWVLAGSATAYSSVAEASGSTLGPRLFFHMLHPTLVMLPIFIAVLWVLTEEELAEVHIALLQG